MDTRDYNELPVMEDLKCRRGDDICRPISLTINGEPVDLTGCTLTLYVTGHAPSQITPDDAEGGLWTLYIAPAITAGEEHGRVLYSVVFHAPEGHAQFPRGATKTLREGTIDLSATVARE